MGFFNSDLVYLLPLVGSAAGALFLLAVMGNRRALRILLFALVVSFEVTFRTRDVMDKSLDPQVLAKLVIWGACGIYALSRINTLRDALRVPAVAAWGLLLAWFAATSMFAPNPVFSLSAVVAMSCVFLFMIVVVEELTEREFASTVITAIGIICGLSLVAYFVMPNSARLWAWDGIADVRTSRIVGITGHSNAIGVIAALGLLVTRIFWSALDPRRRFVHLAIALLCVICLVLSQSRTSAASLVLVLGVNEFLSARGSSRVGFIWLGLAASVGLFAVLAYGSSVQLSLLSRSGDVSELLTFTNRTEIWGAVWPIFQQRPVVGWGYGSGAFIIPLISSQIGFVVAQPHNMALQILLSGGLVALVAFLLAAILSIGTVRRQGGAPGAAFLGFAMIGGLLEHGGFASVPDTSFAILTMAAAFIAKRAVSLRGSPLSPAMPTPPSRSPRHTRLQYSPGGTGRERPLPAVRRSTP